MRLPPPVRSLLPYRSDSLIRRGLLSYPCLCCHLFLWLYLYAVFFNNESVQVFYHLFFICICHWRCKYHEGVGIPLTVLRYLTPSTFLCLSQARTWISLVNLSFHNLLDVVYLNENFIYFYNKIHSLDLKKHKRDTEESV